MLNKNTLDVQKLQGQSEAAVTNYACDRYRLRPRISYRVTDRYTYINILRFLYIHLAQ